MSKTAWVTIPIVGSVSFEVELTDDTDVNDEDSVFSQALDAYYALGEGHKDPIQNPNVEWTYETVQHVTTGNIFWGEHNDFSYDCDDAFWDDDDAFDFDGDEA